MEERQDAITFQGQGLTLVGSEVKVGQQAPQATVLDNDLGAVALSSFKGSVCVICAVPSLDTPVCDLEARRFNQEATKLGDDVKVVVVSTDLPFAQKRWCGAAGVDRVVTLSDHRDTQFGLAYGILIKNLRLLARAVFVIDRAGVVQYVQLVKELEKEPDYKSILEAIEKVR